MKRLLFLGCLFAVVVAATWTPAISPRQVVDRDGSFHVYPVADSGRPTRAEVYQAISDSSGISDWELLHDSFPKWQDMADSIAAGGGLDTLVGDARYLGIDSTAEDSKLLQGKDTTALWNAKTLQTWDTTDIQNCAGESAAAHEGAGVDQQARDTAEAAMAWGLRDSVRLDGKLGTNDTAAVAQEVVANYTVGDTVSKLLGSGNETLLVILKEDTLARRGNMVIDDNLRHKMGAYWSDPITDTCTVNSHVHLDCNLSNFFEVQFDSLLDSLIIDNSHRGQRIWITGIMPSAGTEPTIVISPAPLLDTLADTWNTDSAQVNVLALGYSPLKSKWVGSIGGPFK